MAEAGRCNWVDFGWRRVEKVKAAHTLELTGGCVKLLSGALVVISVVPWTFQVMTDDYETKIKALIPVGDVQLTCQAAERLDG
jgi:hypothetical protein